MDWDSSPINIAVPPFILEKLNQKPVSSNLLSVAIVFIDEWTEEGPLGIGTLYLDNTGRILRIITSEHLFAKGIRHGRAFYRPLQPLSDKWLPIERVIPWQEFSPQHVDIALCLPGKSARIKGFSSYSLKPFKARMRAWLSTNELPLTSLLSGEEVRIIGIAEEQGEAPWTVLLYDGRGHESGLGSFSGKEIYVVSRVLAVTPEWRQKFPIPESFKHISFAHILRIRN
jgi:hypothetical protein